MHQVYRARPLERMSARLLHPRTSRVRSRREGRQGRGGTAVDAGSIVRLVLELLPTAERMSGIQKWISDQVLSCSEQSVNADGELKLRPKRVKLP
jgi:hypothetical protein